ncbi:MAG: GNAT family N-acetyltransferase [Saprospiraceae bacterium]
MLDYTVNKFEDLILEELYEILKLRQEVFIVEQDCPYLDTDGKDQMSWHVCGRNEKGELLAYTRLVPPGISYASYSSIGRVINSISIRGQGEGKRLMEYSINSIMNIFSKNDIKISAQCYLKKFYNALGFIELGEEYLEDNIPHIAMIRKNEM